MRSRRHLPSAAPHRRGELGRCTADLVHAESALGDRHPLVRNLDWTEAALEQLLAMGLVQAVGVTLVLGRQHFGLTLAIAGAVLQCGLGLRLAGLRASRREMCLDLIVEGRDRLPLACLARLESRLLDRRRLVRLARSIDRIVEIAGRPVVRRGPPRPLFALHVIIPVLPELRETARLLRTANPAERGVAGVALAERLVRRGESPLYGREVEPLRQELQRIRYMLAQDSRVVDRAS